MTPSKNSTPQIILYPDPPCSSPVSRSHASTPNSRCWPPKCSSSCAKPAASAWPRSSAINIRLFVMNPTGLPEDDHVLVNPEITEPADEEEAEEGCLQFPEH